MSLSKKILKWLFSTRFAKWKLKLFERRVRRQCYKTIDRLPVFNWWRINEGDLSYLYKEEDEIGIGHRSILEKIALELLDEFIGHFGFGDNMKRIILLEKEIIELRAGKADGNGVNQTFIELRQLEINDIKDKTRVKEMKNQLEITASMERMLKININVDTCSVTKYYSYIKILEKENG